MRIDTKPLCRKSLIVKIKILQHYATRVSRYVALLIRQVANLWLFSVPASPTKKQMKSNIVPWW